jgi:hypothetical protein
MNINDFNRLACKILLCCGPLLDLQCQASDATILRTQPASTQNDYYALKMMNLALSHGDRKYEVVIDQSPTRSQERYADDVMSGVVDIMWAATDEDNEKKMQPIRIPLYKGMLGNRIFLIEKNSQYKFDNVHTLEDLKKLSLGQGSSWADTKILEANGLKVVKTPKYKGLLYMLDGGRFDAFPRGVQEPWSEVNATPGLNLAVEKHIMLVYKMPFYLFVSKNNKSLAQDLELGLNRAIADGSFDKTFREDKAVQEVIEKADLKNRIVFRLINPGLPKETPVDRAELWMDLKELK